MTLEERINKLLKSRGLIPIEIFEWNEERGVPRSREKNNWTESLSSISEDIDKLIKEASVVEAMTSPSKYVRECWRYFNGT